MKHQCGTPNLFKNFNIPQKAKDFHRLHALKFNSELNGLKNRQIGLGNKLFQSTFRPAQTISSEIFSLSWGSEAQFNSSEMEQLNSILELFEISWDIEINQMGYKAPVGSEEYLFNVYMGDSGPEVPSAFGNGGYFWFEDNGQPMIVFSINILEEFESFAGNVAAHEFFHAVQWTYNRYEYSEVAPSAWFIEASAEWIAPKVFPNILELGSFLGAVSIVPQESIYDFDYPDEGVFTEYHQYGAYIFLQYLTEHEVFNDEFIKELFEDTSNETDVLKVIENMTSIPIEDIHHKYGQRQIFWDYARGQNYQAFHNLWADRFPNKPDIALAINGVSEEWHRANRNLFPENLGFNIIEIVNPAEGDYLAQVISGYEGFDVSFVTRNSRSEINYSPIFNREENESENILKSQIISIEEGDEVFLVVNSFNELIDRREYAIQWTEVDIIEDPDIEDPDIEDPNIEDPDIEDPDIEEPDVDDPDEKIQSNRLTSYPKKGCQNSSLQLMSLGIFLFLILINKKFLSSINPKHY